MTIDMNGDDSLASLQAEVNSLRAQLEQAQAAYGSCKDELASVLSALKKSEGHYQSLFAQLPRGLMEEDYSACKLMIDELLAQGVTDLEAHLRANPALVKKIVARRRVTNANEALLNMYRAVSLDELRSDERDFDKWWTSEWTDYYAAEMSALLSSDPYYSTEIADFRVDDTPMVVAILTRVVRGCEDRWDRIITIQEDITARKASEAELLAAKQDAERANQAKSAFLSRMSHELRTPLNAIMGFSQLFEFDSSLGEPQRKRAHEIHEAGKYLLQLIEEVLDLSSIESGQLDLSMESVLVVPVIRDSLSWVESAANVRGIEIVFDPEPLADLTVRVDATRLKQVLLNLLSNAVKYNVESGRVIVSCEKTDTGVLISVRDTGLGIPEQRMTELFEPFNRMGAEYSEIPGTGIGLMITRQLITLMGGVLRVDSVVGSGCMFSMELPRD